MSKAEEVKVYIKVVINKEKTKVLFVEAGSDFTDILLSFLTLPLSTIVNVLDEHFEYNKAPVIGSLNTLRDGVANLDSVHFCYERAKEKYLKPDSAYGRFLGSLKFNCTDPSHSYSGKKYDGVFTRGADSFVISDDLQILPADSVINTLSKLSIAITDMDGAMTRTVAFGLDEIMNLLKELLVSRNPLTALLLSGSRMNLAAVKYEHRNTQIDEEAISMNPKKMVLKVVIQKSTFKLLFAQADTDFINFLFGLLILPLGRVEQYVGSNTGRENIDNLHRSIALDNLDNYLNSASTKDDLINPTPPAIFFGDNCSSNEFDHLNFGPNKKHSPVKGSRMYMVSDNLTVAPMAITSSLSVINELKISFSDVRELKLQVGLEEGLNILKAALTSTTALTDGLIKPKLKNQLKAALTSTTALTDGLIKPMLKNQSKKAESNDLIL